MAGNQAPIPAGHLEPVRLQLIRIHDRQRLLETSGDEMTVYRESRAWLAAAALADRDHATVYERLLSSTSALVDRPPPGAGFFAVINKPLGLLWLAIWPWAQRDIEKTLLDHIQRASIWPPPAQGT